MQDTLTPKIAFWSGAAIVVIGALLLAWAIQMIRTLKRRQRLEQHTTGTVVENRVTTDTENSTFISPVVEFTTVSGQTLRVECTWSTQEKYPVGSRVPVHYDPDKPQEADIAFGLNLLLVGAIGFPAGQ